MKVSLTILSITLWTMSYGQINWTVDDEFKGFVKTVKTTNFSELIGVKFFDINDSIADYNVIETKVILFNKSGMPVKHLWYMNATDTVGYCLWNYNREGQVSMQTDYRKNNNLERRIEYSYKGDTLIIEKYFDNTGKLYSTWKNSIDSTNRERRRIEIVDGKKDDDYMTTLNNFFLPWKEYTINPIGNRLQISELLYDDKKRLISSAFWNKDSTIYFHHMFLFNNESKIIEIKELDKKGQTIQLTKQQFDQSGNIIRIVTIYPGSNDTYSQRIDYVYDKQDNWTSKKTYLEFQNGRNYETAKSIRQIEYY